MDKESSESSPTNYTVVARRYRPREFDQLVGQAPIARALTQAIESGRVGHAYLFTGARGVGKTSTARIFAKALNTSAAATEDLAADIAQAIDAGGDMDVIEIDGASNRGIEEIRQLRANVNVRPSRSPYKIYIIDEVHMLTNQAFNALLKTLEEPPGHVKFIFCTTDPDKIPITVLSRCQRFDFAPVKFEAIQQRLVEICEAEGYTADSDALALLARRAAGSMRDSQSLLEQVMSFSSNQITVEQVHELLGTADEGRLLELAQAMRDANALLSIQLAQDAAQAGADPGQLAEQLLNYLRDIMAIAVGGGPDLLKIANPLGLETLKQLADSWGLQTILSAIQILDESLVRMRSSVSATTLLEVALVQICQLEKMASIAGLLESLQSGPGSSPTRSTVAQQSLASEKKNLTSPRLEAHESSSPSAFQEAEQHASVVPSSTPDLNPPLQNSSATQGESLPTAVLDTSAAKVSSAQTAGSMQPDVAAQQGIAAPVVTPHASEAVASGASQFHTADVADTPKEVPATLASDVPSTASQRESSDGDAGTIGQTVSRSNSSPKYSSDALQRWKSAVTSIDGMLADFASLAVSVEPIGSTQWNIVFPPGGQRPSEYCSQSERKAALQEAVQNSLGRPIRLTFSVMPGAPAEPAARAPQATVRIQQMREVAENPYVKRICEVLGGEILRVDTPQGQPSRPHFSSTAPDALRVGGGET